MGKRKKWRFVRKIVKGHVCKTRYLIGLDEQQRRCGLTLDAVKLLRAELREATGPEEGE